MKITIDWQGIQIATEAEVEEIIEIVKSLVKDHYSTKNTKAPKEKWGVTTTRILEILKQKDKDFFNKKPYQMAKEIGEELGLAKSTVAYHLDKLNPEIEKLKEQHSKEQKKEQLIDPEDGYKPLLKGAFSTRPDPNAGKVEEIELD